MVAGKAGRVAERDEAEREGTAELQGPEKYGTRATTRTAVARVSMDGRRATSELYSTIPA